MIISSHAVAGHNTPHTVAAVAGPHHTGSWPASWLQNAVAAAAAAEAPAAAYIQQSQDTAMANPHYQTQQGSPFDGTMQATQS